MRDTVRSPRFAVASDTAGWTWCKAYSYAAEIEQGGRIPGAAKWTNAQWMAIAQIKAAGLRQAVKEGLLLFEGDDVIVVDYDVDGETKVAAMRERAQQNGARSNGRPRNPVGNPVGNRAGNPLGNPAGNPVGGPSSVSVSVSVSETKTKTGGGSGAAAPLRVLEDPDPDFGTALTAFRKARARAAENNPLITTAEPESDVAELRTVVLALAPADRLLVGKTAEFFFKRSGRDRRDTRWREKRWSMHYFASQGIESCLPDVKSGISLDIDGWPDAYDDDQARAARALFAAESAAGPATTAAEDNSEPDMAFTDAEGEDHIETWAFEREPGEDDISVDDPEFGSGAA